MSKIGKVKITLVILLCLGIGMAELLWLLESIICRTLSLLVRRAFKLRAQHDEQLNTRRLFVHQILYVHLRHVSSRGHRTHCPATQSWTHWGWAIRKWTSKRVDRGRWQKFCHVSLLVVSNLANEFFREVLISRCGFDCGCRLLSCDSQDTYGRMGGLALQKPKPSMFFSYPYTLT